MNGSCERAAAQTREGQLHLSPSTRTGPAEKAKSKHQEKISTGEDFVVDSKAAEAAEVEVSSSIAAPTTMETLAAAAAKPTATNTTGLQLKN